MLKRCSTSRWPLLALVMIFIAPACCCQLGLLRAVLAGQYDSKPVSTCIASESTPGCCCGSEQGRSGSESDEPTDDDAPAGCGGPCCIKGFTVHKTIDVTLLMFAFIAPAPLLPAPVDPIHPGIARVSDIEPPPPCASLLRQRCALII